MEKHQKNELNELKKEYLRMNPVQTGRTILKILTFICCVLCMYFAQAQNRPPITKALVVGISTYQDTTIPSLHKAVRDAELFASFLRVYHRKIDPREHLALYIDEEASLAGLSAGLDWLVDGTQKDDTLILFFSAYVNNESHDPLQGNGLYFYDSPAHYNSSASFNLFAQFKVLAQKKKCVFHCYGNLYPLIFDNLDENIDTLYIRPKENKSPLFKNLAWINQTQRKTLAQLRSEERESKNSLVNYLVKGLMGMADEDMNSVVQIKELQSYFNKQAVFPWIQPGIIFAATSSAKINLSKVNKSNLETIEDLETSLLSPIVSLEVNRKERNVIQQLSDKNRLLYEDFILAIKLGYIIDTSQKNAIYLLETLSKEKEMSSLIGNMRRKLAAALQDEAQQVLNAYLNVDSKELSNRISGNVRYDLYAYYMETAIQLLGGPHYMTRVLKAKKLYFESVQKRITGQKNLNKELISEAINLLLAALELENQASYLYNELGINYSLFGRRDEAKKNFHSAIEFSPTWSIPYTNLAQIYAQEDLSKALRIAKHAIRLSPHNSFAWNVEGSLQLQLQNYPAAEISFNKALKLDPNYAVACYNLACALSLQNKIEDAYEKLEQAISYGIASYDSIIKDPDLDNMKVFALRWKELMNRYFDEK